MNPPTILRIGTLTACLLLPGTRGRASEPADAAFGPRNRSEEIRVAIRAGLPKYQPQPADADVRMTESTEKGVEKDGVLRLPPVTVEARLPRDLNEYNMLTRKGRLELAMKRHPGLRIGNLFGLNNGIALAMLREEHEAAKRNELKEQVERISLEDGPEARELNRLLQGALARPNADWLKGRSGR